MTEFQHGRLYTTADVERVFAETRRTKKSLARIVRDLERAEPFTFPAEEPMLVMRASDRAARSPLSHYRLSAWQMGAPHEHVEALALEMRAWDEYRACRETRVPGA